MLQNPTTSHLDRHTFASCLLIVLLIKCNKTQNVYAITQLKLISKHLSLETDFTETFNYCSITQFYTFLLHVFVFLTTWTLIITPYSNHSLCGEKAELFNDFHHSKRFNFFSLIHNLLNCSAVVFSKILVPRYLMSLIRLWSLSDLLQKYFCFCENFAVKIID